jgi:hypothetical protein
VDRGLIELFFNKPFFVFFLNTQLIIVAWLDREGRGQLDICLEICGALKSWLFSIGYRNPQEQAMSHQLQPFSLALKARSESATTRQCS